LTEGADAMDKVSKLAVLLGCAATLAATACAQNSGIAPAGGIQTNPQVRGAALSQHASFTGTRWTSRSSLQPNFQFTYNGGPVLTKPKMYLIFWGYRSAGDPDNVKPLLEQYAKSIGGSTYNNIYTQYYGHGGNIKNPPKQFGGAWEDNVNAIPAHPTDGQVAAEAIRFVKKFGYDSNGSYVVATAHGHSSSGFGTQWCGYHSDTVYRSKLVSYTNLPYMPDAGASCGANIITPPSDETGTDEGVTIVEGGEYGDSVTDPKPPTGWYTSGEIGSVCVWTNVQNDPFQSNSYAAQPMFSNASSSCVHHYP
jgi:hypothetical protein